MAHVLSGGEKTTLRLPGQWGKYYLAIPEYHVIYSARLNGVPGSGESPNDMISQIAFDGGAGTLGDVLQDMTLYVGSTAGAYDLGMCRIRKAPISGTFYIAETSEIIWVDNAYLTVVDDYSLWQRSIHLDGVTPYMDWDIPYSDQHEDFDPVPAMGTHRVARLVGADVEVTLGPSADAQAWVIGSTIDSVLWTCDGATFDDDTAINPTATFDAAGTYLVYCEFTAATTGKTYTGVRYVIIYDDDNPLIESFLIRNGRGSFESGKFSFDVNLLAEYNQATIRKRSLVILCVEDYASGVPVTMPGQIAGAENILGVGWISDIDNDASSQIQEISFTVESAEYWLREIRDYPAGLEFITGTAAAWTQMPSLSVDRAAWHFLHWRSTATRVMDIQPSGSPLLAFRFTTARANLWERLIAITNPVIFASPHVDQFGRLFIEVEPQMVPVADRDWPVIMELLYEDIEDNIRWVRRDVPALSMLFMSGIYVNTSGGSSSFFAQSPGKSYAHLGDEEAQDNYLIADQDNVIELCGLYYGWRNNPLDNLEIKFTHGMRPLGLFPRQYYAIDLDASEDPRGIGYDGNLIARELSFSIESDSGFMSYDVTFEPESFAGPAIKMEVPGLEGMDFSIPNLPSLQPLPGLPSLPYISLPPTVENPIQPKKVILASSTHGIFYTETFDLSGLDVKWLAMNNGLVGTEMLDVYQMHVTPSGAIYIHLYSYEKIMRASGLGGAWVEVASGSDFINGIHSMGVDPTLSDSIIIVGLGTGISVPGEVRLATNGVLGATAGAVPFRNNKGTTVFSNGKWLSFGSYYGVFTTPWVARYSPAGAYEYDGTINTAVGQDAAIRVAQALGGADSVFQFDLSGAGGFNIITAGGTVATRSTVFNPRGAIQAAAFSPTGVIALAADTNVLVVPHKTTDSGATWSSIAGTTPVGSDVFENCKDNNRWIRAGGIVVSLTMDAGAVWIDKAGDLIQIAAWIDITALRMIQ